MILTEYDRRQVMLMRNTVSDYTNGHISLATLISNLSILINHLQSVTTDWKDRILSHWWNIEITYAMALDEGKVTDEDSEDLLGSISNIKAMLFEALQGPPKYTTLMSAIYDFSKIQLLCYWEDGCVTKAINEKGVFLTNNGLEPDDPNYLEYYAFAVRILEVAVPSNSPTGNFISKVFDGDHLLEVSSEFNEPLKITTLSGEIIWQRGD